MIDISKLQSDLKAQVTGLEIILDPTLTNPPISEAQVAAFKASKGELTAVIAALPVATLEDFTIAGQMIDSLNALVGAVDERLKPEIAKANAIHKSLTGVRGDMASDLEDLTKSLKSKRAVWKAAEDARIAREAAAARAAAEAEALRVQQEQARLAKEAADRIAEEARVAAEAAVEAARIEAARVAEEARLAAEAAAEIEDPMEALAAAEAAEEARVAAEAALAEAARKAEEDQAERAREAELALQLAEQAAQAPVVIPRAVVQPTLAKEDGVTWADKWEVEYPMSEDGKKINEEPVLRAILAEIGKRPDLIGYLKLNLPAINSAGTNQKNLANIPGVRVWNNKIERRSSK